MATKLCNCESAAHFNDVDIWPQYAGTGHAYLGVAAGMWSHEYIGPVCDACVGFACVPNNPAPNN